MKKSKIIIISIVSVLLLGCAIFAVLYFATDVFKSDKEVFYKNVSQIDFSKFMDTTQTTKYQERIKTEKYKNEGSLSIKVNTGAETNINESFNYISQVDNTNKLADSSVTINKEGDELLTINYLRNEDLYGIQFKDIVSQYVAIENNNLKEFVQKLGIRDVTNIPDKIDLSQIMQNNTEGINLEEINQEEIKTIIDKYLNVISENIPESNYSKVEGGYKLTIDIKTLQNILNKILNNLKDDEQVFNLVNSIISTVDDSKQIDFEEYQAILENGIQELSGEVEENYNIAEIITYNEGAIYIKIGIDVEEQKSYIDGYIKQNDDKIILELNKINKTRFQNNVMKITVNKNIDTTEKDLCEIKVIMEEEEEEVGNLNIQITRDGNLESDNIKNGIALSMIMPEEDLDINLECSNNKTFDSTIEIEEFTSNNHVTINELDYIQISNLITNLNNIITQKTGLNAVEFIGGAGVGIISTATMDLQTTMILTGVTTGTMISVNLKAGLFDRAQNTMQETQNAIKQEEELYQNVEQQLEKTEKHSIYEQINGLVSLTNAGKIDVEATYMEAKSKLENQGMAVSQIGEDGKFIVTGEYGEYTYIVTENSINIVTE